MAVALAVEGGGGGAVAVAVAVAGLTKKIVNLMQKDFLIRVWGYLISEIEYQISDIGYRMSGPRPAPTTEIEYQIQ